MVSKRNAADLEIPESGQDQEERKRVLNVLAQRRYRQRKKARLEKLEAHVSNIGSTSDTSASNGTNDDRGYSDAQQQQGLFEFNSSQCVLDELISIQPSDNVQAATTNQPFLTLPDPFAAYDGDFGSGSDIFDTSVLLPSLPSTPLSSDSSQNSSRDSMPWSLIGEQTSIMSQKKCSFPDEAHLEVSVLGLLRGAVSIAKRLNVDDLIWSLTATSPFTEPHMALAEWTHLPSNLKPTLRQLTIPHHPMIDLLPWPSVRDRMILLLTQPPEMRPPQAASPTALIDFVYDIEDSAEGVRISGDDPYSDMNWEVGEKVFNSWWWIFDKDVIRHSNELRAARGAPLLGSGTVLGEVS